MCLLYFNQTITTTTTTIIVQGSRPAIDMAVHICGYTGCVQLTHRSNWAIGRFIMEQARCRGVRKSRWPTTQLTWSALAWANTNTSAFMSHLRINGNTLCLMSYCMLSECLCVIQQSLLITIYCKCILLSVRNQAARGKISETHMSSVLRRPENESRKTRK